jgi:Helix-turn-helix
LAFVNRKRFDETATIGRMDARALLARNLAALMAKSPDLMSQGALHRRSKVAQATIGRILRAETAASVDTLDQLAGAFGLSAWQLIHPKPDMKPGEAAFYANLRRLLDEANGKS